MMHHPHLFLLTAPLLSFSLGHPTPEPAPAPATFQPAQFVMHSTTREKATFPASYELFSSAFKQPEPPVLKAEFKCSWKQHAWSPSFSHIASGYLYHSSKYSKVRADASYSSSIVSSLFDYTNTNAENQVWNTLYTIEPSVSSAPKVWAGFVKPAWPLLEEDVLVKSGAVFGGVVEDRWLGEVATWKIVYGGSGPVTVFLDASGLLVGYDFYDVENRAGIVNRFFNIELGEIDEDVFDFPKQE